MPRKCSSFSLAQCLPAKCFPTKRDAQTEPQPLPDRHSFGTDPEPDAPVVPAVDQTEVLRLCIDSLSGELNELKVKHVSTEEENARLRVENSSQADELRRLRDELRSAKSILGVALATGSPRPHYKPERAEEQQAARPAAAAAEISRRSTQFIEMNEAPAPQAVPEAQLSENVPQPTAAQPAGAAKKASVVIPPLRLNKENSIPLPAPRPYSHLGQAFAPASRVRPSFRPTRAEKQVHSYKPGAYAGVRAPSAPHSQSPKEGRKSAGRSLSASASRETSPKVAAKPAKARVSGGEDLVRAVPPATIDEAGLATPARPAPEGHHSSGNSPAERGSATTPGTRPTPPFASGVPRFAPVLDAARFDVSPRPAGSAPTPRPPSPPSPRLLRLLPERPANDPACPPTHPYL
eukprot:tig00000605_g2473.t1